MKLRTCFLSVLTVVCLDQLTKQWAHHHLIPYEPYAWLPMLNWTLAYNSGVAFSFFNQWGEAQRFFFAGFSAIMSLFLVHWIRRLKPEEGLQRVALSLILGGAIGNLIDRLYYGYVIDFIDLYYKNYHWPVFNLADSAICVGAFLLVIDLGWCVKDKVTS